MGVLLLAQLIELNYNVRNRCIIRSITNSISNRFSMNNNQMESAQAQVNEVVGVMRNNIDKVLERDSKLNDLDYRASNLEASSSMFQQSSRRLKKKYWWQNLKMKLWLGGCGIVIFITIVVIIYFSVPHGGGGGGDSDATTTTPKAVENIGN